ncbi:hypothetical protein IWW50_000935 [Coemansia erecta]|nr:hypothetical protein IWW50_000935 [Coemansia erecta]
MSDLAAFSGLDTTSTNDDDNRGDRNYLSDNDQANNKTITTERRTVFCTTKDCAQDSDWLLYKPNQVVGWVLGSVSFITGVGLLITALATRTSATFLDAALAMLELCVSLFLRSALSLTTMDTHASAAARMYKASMFFEYHAGIELCHVLGVMVMRLFVHFEPLALLKEKYIIVVSRAVSVALAVLACAGTIVMFDEGSVGMRLVQAVSFAVVVVCLALLCVVVRVMGRDGASHYKRQFGIIVAVILLLALWAGYSGSRTFVALDSPARSSEVVFTVLGFGTLLTGGLVLLVLKAPYYYNFDFAVQWSSKI